MFTRLHHVLLAMPRGEEDTARSFYVDVLGMDEIPKPPALAPRGGAWFRAGGVDIHVGVDAEFRPTEKAHPAIEVTDLAGLVDRLRASGRDAEWDLDFPGYRRAYAHDPFGNRIEFLQAL